jgi:membrane protease subunit HflC
VRTSNRTFAVTDDLPEELTDETLQKVDLGRDNLEQEVLANASGRTTDLGIEILDFRFKRINYVQEVRERVYDRMISERQRIAEQFRSEGAGESARINGEKDRELKRITSEAYRSAQEIQGLADAEAADIYARAYNRDPEFYRFLKTMEILETSLEGETVLVLGTDGEFLRYLERSR